jgi:hypothetical protein
MHPYLLEQLTKDRLALLRDEATMYSLAATCRATTRRRRVSTGWRVTLRRLFPWTTAPAATR